MIRADPKLQFRLGRLLRRIIQIRHERRHTFSRRHWVRRPTIVYTPEPVSDPLKACQTERTRTKVGKHLPFRDDILGCQGYIRRETVSPCALPPRLGCPTARYLEYSTRRFGVVLAGEVAYDRSDVVGLRGID